MDEIKGIRDFTAWPVTPVSPALPIRRIQDMEPAPNQAEANEENDCLDLSARARTPSIAEIMVSEVVTIEPDRSLADLAALLEKHHISGVPVVKDDLLLGVATQTDLARHLGLEKGGDAGFHQTLAFDLSVAWPAVLGTTTTRVREIMTRFIYFATEDASVAQVLDMMLKHHIHRVVITRDRRLVGVVTSMDLLGYFRRQLDA